MDKFGYIRGRRGPRGFPGRNALQLERWFDVALLRMFREDEQCTYYFNTETDGVINKDGKYEIKDRGGRHNAVCLQNYIKPVRVEDFYGLPLKNSLYKISDINTALDPPSIMLIAFSFRVLSEPTDQSQYIFTNNSGTRAVSITKDYLSIWGTQSPPMLTYNNKLWNTMIIQYSCVNDDDRENDKCFFSLNMDKGFFRPRGYKIEDSDVYIGGRPNKTNFAHVLIGNFEIYVKHPDPGPYLVPDEIWGLVETDLINRLPIVCPASI